MPKFLREHGLFLLILIISVPIKLATAQNMPWDIDIVPVVSRNVEYLIPPVGTLSSVAAYNLPMLQWLHLPAQWLTGDVWWTIFLSMLTFNLLGTSALYGLGLSMFNKRVALVATVLFTFSEVSVSSSYTAWAQLLLPSFFAMLMLSLWLWIKHEEGFYLALAGVIATAAFMTHFTAVLLYPAMLVIAILAGAKWQWRWLMIGAGVVMLMFAPYMLVQIDRDFIDLKAFLSQEVLVDDAIFAEYETYKPGYTPPVESLPIIEESPNPEPTVIVATAIPITAIPATDAPIPATAITEAVTTPPVQNQVRPRWLRAVDYALEAPSWYWRAMTLAFTHGHRGIDQATPALSSLVDTFFLLPVLMFCVSVFVALWQFGPELSQHKNIRQTFRETEAGRLLLLVIFLSVMVVLMILTRTIDNSSYWTGNISIQFLIASYAVTLLPNTRVTIIGIALGLFVYMGIQNTERSLRLLQHDNDSFSSYNVSIYRHVESAVDYIADDWDGDDTLTVSYDILQDVSNLWWVGAWNSIDPFYTMGMNYDFLLSYHHGLENTNTDPIGTVDNADYIVVYTPSLDNYNLDDYTLAQFGSIVVLKPNE
ncbi:MAG: hypothetical protein Phog2KO_39140 [Phototrophicaceae bacterium]